jgi:hypothetical protein
MATWSELVKACGEQTGAAVLSNFFDNDTNLSIVLGSIGYEVVGANIQPKK